MNRKEVSDILSDKLEDCVVNHGYINRLRKSHLNKYMPRLLTIDLEQYQENNKRIQLMMRQEGFDVVVIRNNDVFSVTFFNEYSPAKTHYDYLKQLILETKEEE